ncbi:MAG: PEGA domain-containing protein [Chloroflexota bacterium]
MRKKILFYISAVVLFTASISLVFSQTTTTGRQRGAANVNLTITSNVKGAQVFINGAAQKGNTPLTVTLAPGPYNITVKAPGYIDGNANVNLTSDQTVNINLTPVTYKLQVTSNVKGAQVYINGALQSGGIPFNTDLPPGNYSIAVKAAGYLDGSATVTISSKNEAVHLNLQPATATVIAMVPNPDIKVFLDGQMVSTQFTVTPGNHEIRFSSGGFDVKGTYSFEAGKTYKVQPVLTINFGF